MLRCAFLNVFTFGSLQRQRHSGTAAVRICRSVLQTPEERTGRAELRMRLPVSLDQGSWSPLRVCFPSPGLRGDGGLAARCSCWWTGVLMSTDYELSEPLERIQSSDCYGTFNRIHTFGVAQNQKQPCLPNSKDDTTEPDSLGLSRQPRSQT